MMRASVLGLLCGLVFAPLPAKAQETEAERTDRGRIVAFIEDSLSGAGRQVILRDFEGALSSRATASQLTIADDEGIWLTVNDIVLDWNRSSLLGGALSVNELTAGEIIFSRAPVAEEGAPAPEATGFSLPDLPVSVEIGKITAARVELGESLLGQPVEGSIEAALALNGGTGSAEVQILRSDDGPEGRITLSASYENASRQLAIDLDAAEGAGGLAVSLLNIPGAPSAVLTVKGAGPLDDFAADIALATEGEDRLAGTITLKGEGEGGDLAFAADLGGDLAPLFLPEYRDFFGNDVALRTNGTRAASGALDLTALELRTRSLALTGAARIAADGLPERLEVDGRLADPGGAVVVLPVSAPVSVASADLRFAYDSAEGERWTASFTGRDLQTGTARLPVFDLTGSGRIDRRGGDPLIGGTLKGAIEGLALQDPALSQALGADLTLETRFWWQQSADELRIGDLRAGGEGLDLTASGAISGLSTGFRVLGTATAKTADLARFSGPSGRDLSGAGEVRLEGHGSPLGGDFDLELTVAAEDLGVDIAEVDAMLRGASRLDLRVLRDPTGTEIRRLSVESTSLSLEGSGEIDSDKVRADLTFAIPDLAKAGPAYGGSARATARIDGPLLNGRADLVLSLLGQDLRLGVAELDRLLAGQTEIALEGTVTDAALQIDRARLTGAQFDGDLSGVLSPDVSDVTGRLRLGELSLIRPEFGGAGELAFALRGNPARAEVTADLTARDLALGIAEVDGLLRGATVARLEAKIASPGSGPRVEIAEARVAGERLKVNLSGVLAPAGSDLTGRVEVTDLAALRPGLGGRLAADFGLTGTAEDAAIAVTAEARDLRAGQAQADRLLAGLTQAEAKLRLTGGQIRVEMARLANPQLRASAEGSLAAESGTLRLDAGLTNLALLMPEFPGPVTLQGTAVQEAQGYRVDLTGTGPGQINARVNGRIGGDLASGDLAITGSAQAGLANPFLGTRVLSGPVAVDLRLNGPFALSSLSGRVSLSGGRLADATLPFALTGLNADLRLGGARAEVNVSAGVSSGGDLAVRGGIGLAAPFDADLGITLSNVVLRDPQLYETRANGVLRLAGPLTGGAVLSGRVALPETEIRIASTGLGAVGDLPELQHVNEPAAVRETRRRAGLLDTAASNNSGPARPYTLDLTISAPNRLFLRGRGLDAELGGELRINGTTDNVIPSGAFNLIRGRLEILGRRLDLTEASLQLEGSFDPYIRIVAATVADGISAGVLIEGQATDPQVTFTSSPALPQEEVLAQILFGRRLESLSALQAVQLANAVATLAGRGGEGIVSRLRQGFGLDDLDVQTSDDGSAQVKAGKYLSENIYTEVTIDQDGKSEISLNLDLTDNLTVKGRVGNDGDTGLGLFYEKDY